MKMIIDCDTHLGLNPNQRGIMCSAEQMIESMDVSGVTIATSWPIYPNDVSKLQENNRYIYESVKKYPDRIIGFGWVNPVLGPDAGVELVKRCMEEYGLRGVKVNGSNNGLVYDDMELLYPVVEEVAKRKGMVLYHTGCNSHNETNPYRTMKMAKLFPETPMWLIHMGGGAMAGDFSSACVDVAKECPNISLVGSEIMPKSILNALKKIGSTRILFGSDSPFQLMDVEKIKFDVLLANRVSKEDAENIMYKNAAKILNIAI
jgi:predicted TIM-barrel fold metal-dependent hydrolase